MKDRKEKIRQAVVSGQFYPDNPQMLTEQIKTFLAKANTRPDFDVKALIVPHAGYDYSGQVAAEAYKKVQGRRFGSVILVAFLHRVFLPGVLVDDADVYETPLGRVPVDLELVEELRNFHPLLNQTVKGSLQEHSLEVQLPFLQKTIPDLKIVPIYIGVQDMANVTALAEALAQAIKNKNVLVVVTTDLSHFHPYAVAVEKDRKTIEMFEKGNAEAINGAATREEAEACGIGPVLTALLLAKKMDWKGPELVCYANSGDVTGERGSVVGYASMVFTGK